MEALKKYVSGKYFFILFLLAFLTACGGGGGSDGKTPPVAGKTSLELDIISISGEPLNLVRATRNGAVIGTSDTAGLISLDKLDADKDISIKLQKDGYANQVYRYRSGAKDTFTRGHFLSVHCMT